MIFQFIHFMKLSTQLRGKFGFRVQMSQKGNHRSLNKKIIFIYMEEFIRKAWLKTKSPSFLFPSGLWATRTDTFEFPTVTSGSRGIITDTVWTATASDRYDQNPLLLHNIGPINQSSVHSHDISDSSDHILPLCCITDTETLHSNTTIKNSNCLTLLP